MSTAVGLWSWDLGADRSLRGIAALGLMSSALIIGFAVFGGAVSARILGVLVLVQGAWNVCIGVLMLGGNLHPR